MRSCSLSSRPLSPGGRSAPAFWLALALAFALAGCCNSREDIVTFERLPEHEGLDCLEVCERTILPQSDSGYELVTCDEGLSGDDAPAVICTFEVTVCTTELH